MAPSHEQEQRDEGLSSFPEPIAGSISTWSKPKIDSDIVSVPSSRSGSTSELEVTLRAGQRQSRPKLHTRHTSGTIIVPAATLQIEADGEEYDEGDARTMSPRRSSEEVDRLEEGLRANMIEYTSSSTSIFMPMLTMLSCRQSKQLQASLLSLVDRVESVKAEHEKLEGGNRFLQSYVGILCDWCGQSLISRTSDILESSCRLAKSRQPVPIKAKARGQSSHRPRLSLDQAAPFVKVTAA